MANVQAGKFITFEGGDGSGKTTQCRLMFKALKLNEIDAMPTHEPGGTVGAGAIRELLVSGAANRWDAMTELLLHNAARSDHVLRAVKPALAKGSWVICDRYVDSTFAYQGYGMGVNLQLIRQMHETAIEGFMPDLTLLFDLDTKEALIRAKGRDDLKNRYEKMDVEFHERMRQGYRKVAQDNAERVVMINALPKQHEVHTAAVAAINKKFGTNIQPLPERMVYEF